MSYIGFNIPPRKRSKPWLPIVIALLLLVAAAIFLLPHGNAAGVQIFKTIDPPKPVSAWKIEVLSDVSGPGTQRFSTRLMRGEVLFVPAGTTFKVLSEPAQASGMFVEAGSANWDHEGGELNPSVQSLDGWLQQCKAPMQPGLYRLVWHGGAPGGDAPVDIMVLTRAEMQPQGDKTIVKVNGKSIGGYLDPAKSSIKRVRENAAQYAIPRYFATLTPQTVNVRLGPDFDLGQLIAYKDYHGPDGKKVYTTQRHSDVLPPRPELIDKLIKLRERLRAKGIKVTKFWVTSGFRTPDYNRAIGGAAFSRHSYGDAVDLCIDEDNDKHMDDLNGDGRIDRKDGIIIGNACRELEAEGAVVPGGIGVYEWDGEDSVRSHVHIDCRGFISRWGQDGAGRYKKSFIWWPKNEFQDDDNGE